MRPTKTERLKYLLKNEKILVAPGTGDALGARLIQLAGFDAVYMSGYVVAGTHGRPDVGLLTMTEVVNRAEQIAEAIDIPVICDADTGYGGIINVIRTVKELERKGVAGIHLEDQTFPKKCGSMAGRKLISLEEMVGKIKAALDARTDKNFLIIARTDAMAVLGIDETMRRGKAYRDAGADMLMFTGPYMKEEIVNIIEEVSAPTAYFHSESLTMPMLPVSELAEIGVKLVFFPIAPTLMAAKAVLDLLKEIKSKGTTAHLLDQMISYHQFNELVGFNEIKALEAKYE